MRFSTILILLAVCGGAAQAQDYELQLIFEATGRPAQIFTDGFESGDISVFNDTIMVVEPAGLLLTREDNDDGRLTGIQTVVPGTREVTWRMTAEDIDALGFNGGVFVAGSNAQGGGGVFNDGAVFVGLVNLFGDGTRDPVFFGDGRLLVVDGKDTPAFTVEIDGVEAGAVRAVDVTGDGTQELIVYLPEEKVVQIWDDADIVRTRPRP